jgi:hypothetical protein
MRHSLDPFVAVCTLSFAIEAQRRPCGLARDLYCPPSCHSAARRLSKAEHDPPAKQNSTRTHEGKQGLEADYVEREGRCSAHCSVCLGGLSLIDWQEAGVVLEARRSTRRTRIHETQRARDAAQCGGDIGFAW